MSGNPYSKIKPLGNRIVIKVEEEKVTKGGIIIPDTADKEKPVAGEVVATGPGAVNKDGKLMPMTVKVGDRVLFSKYSPDEIEFNGEKLLILKEDSVLAILS